MWQEAPSDDSASAPLSSGGSSNDVSMDVVADTDEEDLPLADEDDQPAPLGGTATTMDESADGEAQEPEAQEPETQEPEPMELPVR